MQKTLSDSREFFRNEYLPNEKLVKSFFFSTGGFVMCGRNSRICGKEIDEASQEREMPHQESEGFLVKVVVSHHARASWQGQLCK